MLVLKEKQNIKCENVVANNGVAIDLKERKTFEAALCGKIKERSERRVGSEWLTGAPDMILFRRLAEIRRC